MSLIHEALKKAQRSAPPQGIPFAQGFAMGKRRSPFSWRISVLALLLLLSIGFLLRERVFSGRRAQSSAPLPKVESAAEESRLAEAMQLKEQGVAAFRSGDMDTAWARFTAASTLVTNDAEVWNNLGLVSKRKGDLPRAREAFEKALILRPHYPECLNNVAVLEMGERQWEAAKRRLTKVLELDPASSEAHFHLGIIAERSGDREGAAQHYRLFLKGARELPPHVLDEVRDHVLDLEEP